MIERVKEWLDNHPNSADGAEEIRCLLTRVEELEGENEELKRFKVSNIGGCVNSYRNGSRSAFERAINAISKKIKNGRGSAEWNDPLFQAIDAIRNEMAKGE